jgi:hypothetical protein
MDDEIARPPASPRIDPMEGKIKMARKFRWIGAVTAIACLAGPGVAQACPDTPTSKAFAQFGDNADYSLAPGGDFEGGASSWVLFGNGLTAGNEKFFAAGASHRQSLTIRPGSVVVSPKFCIDEKHPTMRLFAKKLAGSTGSLSVQILYTDTVSLNGLASAGTIIKSSATEHGNYDDWAPSPILKLGSAVPLKQSATGELHVRLAFIADRQPGNWAIDDVFVDPYLAG